MPQRLWLRLPLRAQTTLHMRQTRCARADPGGLGTSRAELRPRPATRLPTAWQAGRPPHPPRSPRNAAPTRSVRANFRRAAATRGGGWPWRAALEGRLLCTGDVRCPETVVQRGRVKCALIRLPRGNGLAGDDALAPRPRHSKLWPRRTPLKQAPTRTELGDEITPAGRCTIADTVLLGDQEP